MQLFDIYFGYFEYKEKTGRKKRPVVIVNVNDNSESAVYIYGVYTYRKWFDLPAYAKILYEIKDWEHAGLDRRSFVDVSRDAEISAEDVHTYKYFGQLSRRDMAGLYAKAKEADGADNLEHAIAEFLKTLELDD
jgi:hypothetical protein